MRTDAELVSAVLNGQKQAYAALVKRYERPWLMKITRRCALTMNSQRPRQASLDLPETFPAESTDGHLDEEKQKLLTAVMKLPESEKQVVMLRYFSGHSVREVAEILGRSLGTVTKQLSRAHKRLRNILKEPGL